MKSIIKLMVVFVCVVWCFVEFPLGYLFPSQSDVTDFVSVDELCRCDLYNYSSSIDPADIALRIGYQV